MRDDRITVINYDTYRSLPLSNMDDEVVRVVLDMPRHKWGLLRKFIEEENNETHL